MKGRSKRLNQNGKHNPKELLSLKGKIRLLRHENLELYFPVFINEIQLDGCSLKASITPINGVGSVEVCMSDLLTLEEANQEIDDDVAISKLKERMSDITHPYYQKERRARFILMIERECSSEEQENLKEEAGGSLSRITDSFIRKHGHRILSNKYLSEKQQEKVDTY